MFVSIYEGMYEKYNSLVCEAKSQRISQNIMQTYDHGYFCFFKKSHSMHL